jgi:chromosome segregation ATPase
LGWKQAVLAVAQRAGIIGLLACAASNLAHALRFAMPHGWKAEKLGVGWPSVGCHTLHGMIRPCESANLERAGMTDIQQIETRLSRALDRISAAAGQIAQQPSAPAPDGSETARLQAELDAERAKTAQLSERVNAVRQRQDSSVTSLERRLARMTEQLDLQSLEMLRLKKANSKLIEANRQLREGVEAQVIEPSTVNRSLLAELEALRAERAAELAEMEDVLGELKPLMEAGERDA